MQQSLHAAQAIIARGASILASFLLTLAIARMLGPAAGGTFFVVFTSLAVFASLARFGTDNLALKFFGGASTAPRRDAVRLQGICAAGSALSVLVALVAFVAGHQLVPGLTPSAALLASTAVAPQAFSVLAGAMLRGTGRLATGILAELGSIPALTVAGLIAEETVSRATLTGAVIALSAASWLTAAWAVPAALRSMSLLPADATSDTSATLLADFLRKHLSGLASMMGTSLLFYVLTWAPVFVLAVTRGPRDVAFFTVAARLAAFISLAPSIQISYLAPAFARLYHHGELRALNDLCNRSAWQAGIVATPPALIFVAASEPTIGVLYGTGFSRASVALVLLAILNLVSALAGQVNQLMLLCELERAALLLNLCWLVTWVVVGPLLSWLGGVDAVSGLALVSGVLYSVVSARLLARSRGIYSFVRVPVRFTG